MPISWRKCDKMVVMQIPSRFFFWSTRPECYQIRVTTIGQDRDVQLPKSSPSRDRKCVKMADLVNFCGNRMNSFKTLLLQTHQPEYYQICVATLGHSHNVKLWRPCWSLDQKCVKMVDLVNFLENRINSIPSKIFLSRPASQNSTKFGLQHSARA